jgi:hypothetical protein
MHIRRANGREQRLDFNAYDGPIRGFQLFFVTTPDDRYNDILHSDIHGHIRLEVSKDTTRRFFAWLDNTTYIGN